MADFDTEDVDLLLDAVKSRQKFPRSCVKAYERLGDAAPDTTERLFFDCGGIPAWAAYVLTEKVANSTGHASGKAKRQRLLGRIAATTSESRRNLAAQVAAATEPDRERIEQLVRTAQHQPDRIRRPISMALQTSKGNSDGEDGELPDHEVQDSQLEVTSSTTLEAPSGRRQVYQRASLAECSHLFPPYLASSIRRISEPSHSPSVFAAITLSPVSSSLEYQLKLEVVENKIEHIARELFGAHVETEAGLRYVYLMGSTATKAIPYPNLILKGCIITKAYQLLGAEVANAVFSTSTHQLEIKEGRECFDCITMVIRQASSESAEILLLLSPERGVMLRHRLFHEAGSATRDSI